MTGFSGTRLADQGVDTTKADADGITIETNGASLRILDVSGVRGPGSDPATDATEIAAYNARTIGQVFGVALDDALDPTSKSPAPNIYTTATSAYGLNIVLPPETPTGWPRRTIGGDQTATWMDGQWGIGQAADGKPADGGPGSIWRIDGITGQATLFANITTDGKPNSAAGLGNIAYDATSHEFFVSDLESGLIHRLSLTGQDLGTFDHGVTARQTLQLPAIADDPSARADIKSMQFRSDNPGTWGFAAPSRRVWGLNVSAGRLYYAVADGPEVWSVAIKQDGDFGDARREIIVPADQGPFEVTDITFDSKGWIYLAQRPPVTGNYDYMFLAAEAPAKLLRYKPDPTTNSWTQVPDEYHVGLQADRRQSDGGVALGYGYASDGKIDYGTCDGTLWATGDDLDRSPRKTANIGKSDTTDGSAGLNVSGLQGSPTDPNALTPESLRFSDYDGILPAAPTRGQIGDIRVFKNCGSPSASAAPVEVEQTADVIDLQVEKIARGACRLDGICHIEVKIWNRSDRRYFGPLTIADTLDKAGAVLTDNGPSRWSCGQGGGDISCHHPGLDIRPGLSTSLFLDYRLPARWSYPEFADCVDIAWLGDVTSPQTIVSVEIELARQGLYTGEIDRIFGPRLQGAIETFSQARGGKISEITPALIDMLFGPGSAIPRDRAHIHERACARFHIDIPTNVTVYVPPPPIIIWRDPPIITIPVVTPVCPYGYWSRFGECVHSCPWGYHSYGDRCFPDGGPVCRDGWFNRGQCQCPEGYTGVRDRDGRMVCQPGHGGPTKCLGGFLDGNQCLCPAGKRPINTQNGSVICEPIHIPCDGGSIFNGKCGCPGGEVFRDGKCVGGPLTCPPGEVFRDGHCVGGPIGCPPGEVFRGGRCVGGPIGCPQGEVFRDGRCIGGPLACPPGEIFRNGHCEGATVICPLGEILRDGKCGPNIPVHCLANELLRDGKCTPNLPACPVGEIFRNGRCEGQPVACPAGQLVRDGKCVTNSLPACPVGEVFRNGKCEGQQILCPLGQVMRDGKCVSNIGIFPVACPTGEVVRDGKCVSATNAKCPTGESIRDGHCVVNGLQPNPTFCPAGETLVNGKCQKTAATGTSPVLGNTCPVGERRSNGTCRTANKLPVNATPVVGVVNCPEGEVRQGNKCMRPKLERTIPVVHNNVTTTPSHTTNVVQPRTPPHIVQQVHTTPVVRQVVHAPPRVVQPVHNTAPHTCKKLPNGKCA